MTSSAVGWIRSVAICVVLVSSTSEAAAQARGGMSDAERTAAEEELDDGRLRGAELARELPGMETASGLPRVVFFPAFGLRVPYQFFGLGLTVEGLPVDWLRLGGLYSFGMSPTEGGLVWTSYAEAMLGVRLIHSTGEDRVDIRLKKKRVGLFTAYPDVLKAWVPSHHALFVEAGALTGFFSLETCTDCEAEDGSEPPPDDRQYVIPLGGLRYVYGYDVRSKGRNLRGRFLLQLYAHVLGPPFNKPDGPRYFANGESAGKPGFGGRVGIAVPPFSTCIAEFVLGLDCVDGNIAVGYAPHPRFVLFEVQAGVAFY